MSVRFVVSTIASMLRSTSGARPGLEVVLVMLRVVLDGCLMLALLLLFILPATPRVYTQHGIPPAYFAFGILGLGERHEHVRDDGRLRLNEGGHAGRKVRHVE